jgi:uncharacterized protein (DUF2141 family)
MNTNLNSKIMQQIIIIIALLFSSVILAQTNENSTKVEGTSITVSVVNALRDQGTISFSLFNEEGFIKEPIMSKSSSIEKGIGTVQFKNVPKGDYAVICFHDENENKKMDFHENGMPKESYGTSNNVFLMGPPQFDNSKFEVGDKEVKLEIKF